MIRSVGPAGPLKVAGLVAWQLRYDLIAVLVVAAVMVGLSDVVDLGAAGAVVPLLGVVVSIFIGFRNTSAYNRWWEARTQWGVLVGNCRAVGNALTAVDDLSPAMATVIDRMRRRQVRHAWAVAAELRGVPAPPGVVELAPEDPADTDANALLTRQSADIRDLVVADLIDRQGRSILINLMTAQTAAAGALERIRHQPIPAYYGLFVRALAWFFAILVCTRLDVSGHDSVVGIAVGILVMTLFIVAERLGHFIEEPMSNTIFDLPMDRFCATVTKDLLGADHPLAHTAGDGATVWR